VWLLRSHNGLGEKISGDSEKIAEGNRFSGGGGEKRERKKVEKWVEEGCGRTPKSSSSDTFERESGE